MGNKITPMNQKKNVILRTKLWLLSKRMKKRVSLCLSKKVLTKTSLPFLLISQMKQMVSKTNLMSHKKHLAFTQQVTKTSRLSSLVSATRLVSLASLTTQVVKMKTRKRNLRIRRKIWWKNSITSILWLAEINILKRWLPSLVSSQLLSASVETKNRTRTASRCLCKQ